MNKIIKCIISFLLITGTLLLLFPTTSKYVNKTSFEKEYVSFKENIVKTTDNKTNEDLKWLYDDSLEYNNSLIENQMLTDDFYKAALDLSTYNIDNNIYGYISIPNIDLTLPIYLGATDNNMEKGAVHLMNTSLPFSSNGTNCVIAGHTGFLGKTIFDNITKLKVDDMIYIENYFEKLSYKVCESKTITKEVNEDFMINKHKDKLILVTCIDYGENRYIVICDKI